MPLIKSASKKALSKNIETEMKAGKPKDQSIAIAYATRRQAMKRKMAKGGELDARDESMSKNSIDSAKTDRDEDMLDSHPMSHKAEKRAASSMPKADDSDGMEMDMLHQENQEDSYSKDGIVRYAEGGELSDSDKLDRISAIRRRMKMMAEGGDVADLDHNSDEDLNLEDQLSFEAARKHTYYDNDQMEDQPEDSNEHGRKLSDEDEHDMVSMIRRKMKK